MNPIHRLFFIVLTFLIASARADVPQLVNHQGRIAVGTVNFDGTGQFKFALVNTDGTESYWSNDNSSAVGSEPSTFVSLTVAKGLYSILLGDTSIANMSALSPAVFDNEDVRLRVWFNDGVNGFEHITPDHRLVSAPYALNAFRADEILLQNIVTTPISPVVAWGGNLAGQTDVPPLSNVIGIAAGSTQSLALLADGTVIAWGTGPAFPGGLSNVTDLAAGTSHFLARKSDGTVIAWGDDSQGQSADQGLTTTTKVAAGEKHSLALLANGTVIAWGDNTFNQTTVPVGLSSVIAIAAGYDHSLALKDDGTVVAWGRNEAGQTTVPGGLDNVVAIAAGAFHSLAAKADGTVVAWGWNVGGQITVPGGLSDVVDISGGYAYSVALKSDGTLVLWGDNSDEQTILPAEATRITAIAAGASHVLALRADLIPAQVARLDQDNVFNGKVGINRTPATNTLEVEGQASKSAAGNWVANSDRRIKTEIEPVSQALRTLDQVRLVDFRYTDDYLANHPAIEDRRYLNVIAQEFAQVFPEHVKGSGEFLPDGTEILQVDTYPLTIYSAAAIQELHRENEAMKKTIAEQEARLRRLEAIVNPAHQ